MESTYVPCPQVQRDVTVAEGVCEGPSFRSRCKTIDVCTVEGVGCGGGVGVPEWEGTEWPERNPGDRSVRVGGVSVEPGRGGPVLRVGIVSTRSFFV